MRIRVVFLCALAFICAVSIIGLVGCDLPGPSAPPRFNVTGYWEGELENGGKSNLQLDLAEANGEIVGYVRIVTEQAILILNIASGLVNPEEKTVSFRAEGTVQPSGTKYSYAFEGQAEWTGYSWGRLSGEGVCTYGDSEYSFTWWAEKTAP